MNNENQGEFFVNGKISSPTDVLDYLSYCSYEANRGYGMSHEALVSIGMGNDKFREKYERDQLGKTNISEVE